MSKEQEQRQEEAKHVNIFEEIEEEVDETVHPFLEWILDHIKPIGIGIGAIVLGVAVYSGIDYYHTKNIQQAKQQLGLILINSKNKARDLEQFLNKAPDKLKPAIYIELAKIYVNEGNSNKGLEVLKKLEKVDDDIYPICVLTEVNLLMNENKYQDAYKLLKSVENKMPTTYKKEVLLKKALLAEKTKDFKQAYACYQELKSEYKGEDTSYFEYKLNILKDKLEG
ncbi:MAG: hypothetical protein Q9M37_02745 [Desulfonauticus sp.]|nr:hypothetical protein [Desulfonauticus sp.]